MNRLFVSTLLIVLATGCSSTSLSGEVSGTGVGNVKTAVFDRVTYEIFGFSIEANVLLMSDMNDSCAVIEDFMSVRDDDCVDSCTDIGALADEHLGRDEYWWSVVSMNPYAENTGTYAFNSDFEDPGDFTASFASLDIADAYNQDACVDVCEAGDDVLRSEDREATGGSVVIDSFENNAEMKGSLDVTFPGDETVSGKFKAEHCDLEEFVLALIFAR